MLFPPILAFSISAIFANPGLQHFCYSSGIFQTVSIFGCQSRPYHHFQYSAFLLFIGHLSSPFNLWLPIQALSPFSIFSISAIYRASFIPFQSLAANPGLITIFNIQHFCYLSGIFHPLSIFGCQSRPYHHFQYSAFLLFVRHLSTHYNLWLPIQALSPLAFSTLTLLYN